MSEAGNEAVALVLRIVREPLDGADPCLQDILWGLGGTSVTATFLVARLRRNGLEVTLDEVLTAESLGEIARRARPIRPPSGSSGVQAPVAPLTMVTLAARSGSCWRPISPSQPTAPSRRSSPSGALRPQSPRCATRRRPARSHAVPAAPQN